MMKRALAACAALGLVAIAACTPSLHAVQLAPATTPDTLAFLVGDAPGSHPSGEPIAGLSVVSCDGERAYWTIAADGSRTLPKRVIYGREVPGFRARFGPLPLTPGCYDVVVSDSRPLRFTVDAAGHAHGPPPR